MILLIQYRSLGEGVKADLNQRILSRILAKYVTIPDIFETLK